MRLLALALVLLCAGCVNGHRLQQEMAAGRTAEAEGQLEDAARHFREALNEAESLPPEHPARTEAQDRLAVVEFSLGRNVEAAALFQKSGTALERILGSNHPTLAINLRSQGEVLRVLGRFNEAEPLLARAVDILEHTLGPHHLTTAAAYDSLGRLHHAAGRFAKAESLYRRALAIRERQLPALDAQVAETLDNLADVLARTGREAEGEELKARGRE